MQPYRLLLAILCFLIGKTAYAQLQDVEFHSGGQFLAGKAILKVKRDFKDPFLWVLAKNNQVFRINSITMAVDDYTPKFTQYNNLQFIDIAGKNKDTVYLASNSANVVEYKGGVTKVIGAADGLADNVTSIGISNFAGYMHYGTLQIGTTKGRGEYDVATGQLSYNIYYKETNIKIYEAGYRNFTATENSYNYSFPTDIPVSNYGLSGAEIFTLSPNSESGDNVNTVLGTQPYLSSPAQGSFYETSVFWGNEKGLFEESAFRDNNGIPFNHKLTGIKVNKITNIFGLASLGSPYSNGGSILIKENLLVGTDVGLYFSSSIYGNFKGYLHTYKMFHYDLLGNVPVNDICVNGTAGDYMDAPQGCENGVWVATDNGLYLIKADYGKYLDPKARLQGVFCENVAFPDTSSIVQLCQGDDARFYLNSNVGDNNTIQWVKDGIDLPGKTDRKLAVTAPGNYYAVIYASCENVHVETNHFTVKVTSAPIFSFNYPDTLQYCDRPSTILSTDNQASYHYRWYTNGSLNGGTTNTYTVTQSGKYKVEVSACTDSWVPSKDIEVDLVNLPQPTITADQPDHCAGDNALLTVDVPLNPSYSVNWYLDGLILSSEKDKTSIQATANGNYSVTLKSNTANCTSVSNVLPLIFTPAPVFTFNYPDKLQYCVGTPVVLTVLGSNAYKYRWYTNGVLNGNTTQTQNIIQSGKYSVEVSSCKGTWMPSKDVNVDLLSIPTPVIKTDKSSYCIGDNATLSIAVPADPSYVINWFKDNIQLFELINQTSVNTGLNGDYTVQITAQTANNDGSVCSQTSVVQNIDFKPLPTVSIQQIIKTNLCNGQSVDLKVSYDTGAVHWSTGESSDNITINTPGVYIATITNGAGCTTDANTNVQFLPNPVLQLPNTAVCVSAKKMATLTAPAGMVSYIWNGVQGANIYTVDHPQTVKLTVTDANGCQASQDIKVTDECPEMIIPNAFTPNGDGIHDKWELAGLEYDPTAIVKIFNRYGQLIYQSRGYAKAWDGTFNSKKLPAAVYYYLIKAKNNSETYSGSVTIIF